MRYQSVIDVNNKNNSHTLAIDFIGQVAGSGSLNILDVGCSAGYFGEYLKKLGHNVTGVDIDPTSVRVAKDFLDEVHCEYIEVFFEQQPNRKFDVIVFGDVLEHLPNPSKLLQIALSHLNYSGYVISSIPNVTHSAIRALLLEGRWEYSTLGILDNTHLRFFDKNGILKLFSDSDYDVLDMKSVSLSVELVDNLCNLNLNSYFVEKVEEIVKNDESASVFQYVTLAKPKQAKIRVVCYAPDFSIALFDLRIFNPINDWATRFSGLVRYRNIFEITPIDLYWGDVFVFQRVSSPKILEVIKVLQKHGKKVVFDIDDLLFELPDFLSHHKNSKSVNKNLIETVKTVDVVTTTTIRLAERLQILNRNVFIVPNCVDGVVNKVDSSFDSISLTTILIASSDHVMVDMLLEPLRYIKSKFSNSIQIVVIGPISNAFISAGIDVKAYERLAYEDFKNLTLQLPNPIGLIPLDESVFSSCKSPIKYFDYTSAGIPVVCSNVPPYSDYIKNNETGFLVNNEYESWVGIIEYLIDNPGVRFKVVKNAVDYMSNTHLINKAGEAWEQVIQYLDVKTVDATQLLSYRVNGEKLKNIFLLFREILIPINHYKVFRVLRNEGISGLIKRLKRYI